MKFSLHVCLFLLAPACLTSLGCGPSTPSMEGKWEGTVKVDEARPRQHSPEKMAMSMEFQSDGTATVVVQAGGTTLTTQGPYELLPFGKKYVLHVEPKTKGRAEYSAVITFTDSDHFSAEASDKAQAAGIARIDFARQAG